MMIHNSLFTITYFDGRGAEPLSPKDINKRILKHAKNNGYILVNLCKKMTKIPFECSQEDVRFFKCSDSIVYRYKQMQMMMFRVFKKDTEEIEEQEEEFEIEEIVDRRFSKDGNVEEWLVQGKGAEDKTWENRNNIVMNYGDDDTLWEAEKIIETDTDGSQYVKWQGFGNVFNSWVDKNGLEF